MSNLIILESETEMNEIKQYTNVGLTRRIRSPLAYEGKKKGAKLGKS